MTEPLDKLRDAIQEYVQTIEQPNLVLTDFAIGYAAIDMRTADTDSFIGSAASGGRHSTIGLAHILVNDLEIGDDE